MLMQSMPEILKNKVLLVKIIKKLLSWKGSTNRLHIWMDIITNWTKIMVKMFILGGILELKSI